MKTTEDKTYNGWSNYETWNWKLWLDNDQGTYEYWRERTREAWKDAETDCPKYFTRSEQARIALMHALKDDAEEGTPTVSGPYCDLLNAALSEVDWLEIASSLLDAEDLDGYEVPS